MLTHYHEAMHAEPVPVRRIAFFGGSFDPPHAGHLAIARAALAGLSLDRVLFAPVGSQPLKPHGASASFEDRLAMTRLAIAGQQGFEISLADAPFSEAPASSPNYTINTLLRLRSELPPGSALSCLMGADSFLILRHWHRAAEIPFVAPLIVAARPGQSLDDLASCLPHGLTLLQADSASPEIDPLTVRVYRVCNVHGATAPLYLLPGVHVDISASQIRDAIERAGHAAEEFLPPAVADYIRAHGLYRKALTCEPTIERLR